MKRMKMIVILFLIAVMTVPSFSTANAAGQGGDLAYIARQQKTGENNSIYTKWFNGSTNYVPWCAIFVSWCAEQAGVSPNVIPKTSWTPTMYETITGNGGTVVSTPQAGDLVFYSHGGAWVHVGIMLDGTSSVQGNIWDVEWGRVKHMPSSGPYGFWGSETCNCTPTYVRPNYSSTPHTCSFQGDYLENVHRSEEGEFGHRHFSQCACGNTERIYVSPSVKSDCSYCINHTHYYVSGGRYKAEHRNGGHEYYDECINPIATCNTRTVFNGAIGYLDSCTLCSEPVTIDDGLYRIIHNTSGKAVGVDSTDTQRTFTVQPSNASDTRQVFLISRAGYDAQGSVKYRITNLWSEKSAAVVNGSNVDGAHIAQFPYSDSAEKQWTLRQHENGAGIYYWIRNVSSGKYWCIDNANPNDGTYFYQWGFNGQAGEGYRLEKFEFPVASVEDGYYRIVHKNSGKVVDVQSGNEGEQFTLNQKNSNNSQIFRVTGSGSGSNKKYSIVNYATSKAVGIGNASNQVGERVCQYTNDGSKSKQWRIRTFSGGALLLQNEGSGLYLDLNGGDYNNGDYFHQWPANAGLAQQFVLEKAAPTAPPSAGIVDSITTSKSTYESGEDIKVKWGMSKNADIYVLDLLGVDVSFSKTFDYLSSTPPTGWVTLDVADIPPGKYEISVRGFINGIGPGAPRTTYFTIVPKVISPEIPPEISPENPPEMPPDIKVERPDVNQDGFINATDVNTIRNVNNYNKPTTAAGVNPNADVNGDGFVNATDVNIVRNINNYNRPAQ